MIEVSDFSVTNIHIIHLPFKNLVRVTGLEPAHHRALEPKGRVMLLKLLTKPVINIISDDFNDVKYVRAVCLDSRY